VFEIQKYQTKQILHSQFALDTKNMEKQIEFTQQQKTILVVDNYPTNVKLLQVILKKNNYNVISATNGKDALNLVKTLKPDLVLLDIMMPDIDGYEVLTQIVNNEITKKIPVIIVSAKSSRKDIQYALDLGAVNYITKPIFIKEVISKVNIIL